MFEWFDTHPFKSIVGYTILVAGAVFAFSKFVLIENTEKAHSTQLETKDAVIQQKEAVISQYEARIRFLETENTRLEEDKNRYLGWLQASPDSFQYIEKENNELREKLEADKYNVSVDGVSQEQKYSKNYETVRKGMTIIDEHTGIVAAIPEMYVGSKGTLSISVPGREMETFRDVVSGFTREYEIKGQRYQFILVTLDYISDRYSVLIRQL